MITLPQIELDEVIQSIIAHPEYMDTHYVSETYRSYGLNVIPDPFDSQLILIIKQALTTEKPLSLIRMGDGEINLLTNGMYFSTPSLNQYAVESIVDKQQDRFKVTPLWRLMLQNLMMGSLLHADIIGVLGVWNFTPSGFTTKGLAKRFLNDPRGVSGVWRGVDYMLKLASQGCFHNKILTSAHIYFSLIESLDELIPLTNKVFVISDRRKVFENLKKKYPNSSFQFIEIGFRHTESLCEEPDFLWSVYSRLPPDMSNTLSLIGAGPWAEIYCSWIKQRRGVALDVGSGMDLLDGVKTRPVHKRLSKERTQKHAL